LTGYNCWAKILGGRLPPGTSLAHTEQVGTEAHSLSIHLVAYRKKDKQTHIPAAPIFKIYMGKGKSAGHLVHCTGRRLSSKTTVGELHTNSRAQLSDELCEEWISLPSCDVHCGLTNRKTFCFITYFKDTNHICCSEAWYVSLIFTV